MKGYEQKQGATASGCQKSRSEGEVAAGHPWLVISHRSVVVRLKQWSDIGSRDRDAVPRFAMS
jgi:hypothetical protein